MQINPTNILHAAEERSRNGAFNSLSTRNIHKITLLLPPSSKQTLALVSMMVLFILMLSSNSTAQTEPPKLELGAHFSALPIDDDPTNNSICDVCDTFTYTGIGGRVTYNVSNSLALESEINFFLRENERMTSRRVGGRPYRDCLV